MIKSKFNVGDRVRAPYHGLGVVAELHDDGRNYPLGVEWLEKPYEHVITPFTEDGFFNKAVHRRSRPAYCS